MFQSSHHPFSKTAHLAKRLAQPFSKKTLLLLARMGRSTLVALVLAGVAHAQGTMDFSGAQTLMGTFNYRNDYRGEEEWSRFIFEDHYSYDPQLYTRHEALAKTWDGTLRSQLFADVFTDRCIVR